MGTFSLAISDADRHRLSIAGVDIVRGQGQSGLGENTWFKATPQGPSFKTRKGADGAKARARTNERGLDIEVTLLQTSASNDFLSALHLSDINLPNGAGVGSLVLDDLGGTTLIECSKAWISQPGEIVRSSGIEEVVWKIEAIFDVYLVGSNLQNVCLGADVDAFYAGSEPTCLGVMPTSNEVDDLMAHAY